MLGNGEDTHRHVMTVAVTSGKGGVGKTNVVVNLAIALKRHGKRVMILDADLGLSNIDILLQLAPRHTIQHVLNGEMGLKDVVIEGPCGIKILPASSGVQELTALDEFQRLRILEEFDAYDEEVDILLIDTAAGISENVAFFCIAAEQTVIVTSPEPTALTDAYALIKVLSTRYQEKEFKVLVNSSRNAQEAIDIFKRLSIAAERFLNISLDYLGFIPYDNTVQRAVRAQRAFVEAYPGCGAAKGISGITEKLLDSRTRVKGNLQFFIGNLLTASAEAAR